MSPSQGPTLAEIEEICAEAIALMREHLKEKLPQAFAPKNEES